MVDSSLTKQNIALAIASVDAAAIIGGGVYFQKKCLLLEARITELETVMETLKKELKSYRNKQENENTRLERMISSRSQPATTGALTTQRSKSILKTVKSHSNGRSSYDSSENSGEDSEEEIMKDLHKVTSR